MTFWLGGSLAFLVLQISEGDMGLLTGPFRTGIFFLLISALLHIFAFVAGGFSVDALSLIPVGILFVGLAMGLARGWRWLAHLVFLGLIIGGIIAITYVWSNSTVPSWWYTAIIVTDWLAAAALFGALWRSPDTAYQA